MPRIAMPLGHLGTENLPRTNRSLENCFNNGNGVIINMPGISSFLSATTSSVARGAFVWNDDLYAVFSTNLIKIDVDAETTETIGTIAGTADLRVAIGFNDAVIVVNAIAGKIYALSNSSTLITITSVATNGGIAVFNHVGTNPAVGNTITISGFTTNTAYNITGIITTSTSTTTPISGVTDNSGIAVFTHAGTTPAVGQGITISGFVTNTSYNISGTVTLSTSTTFEISSISFGSSETVGSFTLGTFEISSITFGSDESIGSFTLVLSAIDGNDNFVPCAAVAHINGRFNYIPFDGDPSFFSDVGAAGTVNVLSFFDAEELPDKNSTTFNSRNVLYIGGTDSFELFRDSGATPNPFVRVAGARIDAGFIGGLLEYNGTFLFIGKEKDQDFGVYAIGQGTAPKISNARIDLLLSTKTTTQLAATVSGRVKWRGYDIAAFTVGSESFGFYGGNWFLLSSTSGGSTTAWSGDHIAQFKGDYYSFNNSDIGKFEKINTDYGEPIARLIETVIEKEDALWFSVKKLELGISQGFNTGLVIDITSVTDSSSVAQFNFTAAAAITLAVGQQVTIQDFATNTAYNITGIITVTDTTSSFEISSIAFGSSETVGNFTSLALSAGSVALQTSRDNVNFDDEVFRTLGKLGEYEKRLIWKYAGGIGKFQGFMGMRFKSSENVDFSAQFIDVEIG